MDLCSLPEDVLFHIMNYLKPEDCLSLASEIEKFDVIYKKKLAAERSLNIARSYMITTELFRKIKSCLGSRMHSFDASGCHWIPAHLLLEAIVSMTCLEELYVNDTKLSLNHLPAIFRSCSRIKCLAFSFGYCRSRIIGRDIMESNETSDIRVLQRGFSRLTTLRISDTETTGANFWIVVMQILKWCVSCVHLRFEPNYGTETDFRRLSYAEAGILAYDTFDTLDWIKNLQSFEYQERGRAVHRRKVIKCISDALMTRRLPNLRRFCVQYKMPAAQDIHSSILWSTDDPVHKGGEIRWRKVPNCNQLTHISGIKFSEFKRMPNLRSCSGYCYSKQKLDLFCRSHPSLKKLCIVDMAYMNINRRIKRDWTLPDLETLEIVREIPKDASDSEECVSSSGLVDLLLDACPNLRQLKVMGTDEVSDSDIVDRICKLQKLRHLKIETDTAEHLSKILEECKQLECLHVQPHAGGIYAADLLHRLNLPANIREFAINWGAIPIALVVDMAKKWTHLETLILQYDRKLAIAMGGWHYLAFNDFEEIPELLCKMVGEMKRLKHFCLTVQLHEDSIVPLKRVLKERIQTVRPNFRFYIGPHLGHSYYPYE